MLLVACYTSHGKVDLFTSFIYQSPWITRKNIIGEGGDVGYFQRRLVKSHTPRPPCLRRCERKTTQNRYFYRESTSASMGATAQSFAAQPQSVSAILQTRDTAISNIPVIIYIYFLPLSTLLLCGFRCPLCLGQVVVTKQIILSIIFVSVSLTGVSETPPLIADVPNTRFCCLLSASFQARKNKKQI